MRTRNAIAKAREAPTDGGTNAGTTLMITPRTIPPTRLPHIFPGPPRTTMTKLIGANVSPMSGLMLVGSQTARRAPPSIVADRPSAVAIAATNVGLIPTNCAAAVS